MTNKTEKLPIKLSSKKIKDPICSCINCGVEVPESQGSFSFQYDESGAFFVCNICASEEQHNYDRFVEGEVDDGYEENLN